MQQQFISNQFSDVEGNPAGGTTYGPGFSIGWQNGPLNRGGDRTEPNGAFVETIIAAVVDRLEFYQRSKFVSNYNAAALDHLNAALSTLHGRTAEREARAVEGTHQV